MTEEARPGLPSWFWTAIGIAALPILFWFFFLRDDDATGPTARSAQSYIDEYGGSLTAIQSILRYNDCDVLARTFDDANANAQAFGVATDRGKEQRGRMAAADDRMDAIGCD